MKRGFGEHRQRAKVGENREETSISLYMGKVFSVDGPLVCCSAEQDKKKRKNHLHDQIRPGGGFMDRSLPPVYQKRGGSVVAALLGHLLVAAEALERIGVRIPLPLFLIFFLSR